MFLLRKIGSVLRGKATRGQILMATILGGMLGFVPGFFLPGNIGGGFAQAPGLILGLLFLVLILNANFAVFGLTTLVAKLTSLLLVPVSFAIGRFLLDGPLQGLFRWLVNAPVTAWFGLEHYATAGGLVLGLVFGVASGLLLVRMLTAIRLHMANVEENSERYQKFAGKGWVKVCAWLFLGGGKGKKSWRELAESHKFGLPIRISGVIVVGLLCASIYVFQQFFSSAILTRSLRSGLTTANGATVDLDAASLDLADGTLRVSKLAVADAKKLTHDLLAADLLTARVDTKELLRKRLVVDEVRSTNAHIGAARATPGIAQPPASPPPPEPTPPAGTKTIDDYMKDVDVWRQRLEQARDWIQRLTGGEKTPPAQRSPEDIQREREEQVRTKGMVAAVATHLLEGAPSLLIRKVDFEGVDITIDGAAEKIDLHGRNLSTDASLLPASDLTTFALQTQSDKLKLALTGPQTGTSGIGLDFAWRRLPVDAVFGQLKLAGAPPVHGGTMDLTTTGSLQGRTGTPLTMDLPLQVALKNTTFALLGAKETKVESLALPIGLRGGLTRPSVYLDDKALQDALTKAGQAELANFVQGQAGKLLGGTGIGAIVDPSKSVGDQVDAAKKAAADAAKKALEDAAKGDLKKGVEEGLKGLIPGGKKKN